MFDSDDAHRAVSHFNRTYIDTSLVSVELARGVNDPSLARPWSRYSEGSSRFAGKPGDEEQQNKKKPALPLSGKRGRTESLDQLEKERDEKFAQFLKLAMPNKKMSEEKVILLRRSGFQRSCGNFVGSAQCRGKIPKKRRTKGRKKRRRKRSWMIWPGCAPSRASSPPPPPATSPRKQK